MAKSNTYQKFVLKIHSSRLRNSKWDLKITLSEARENDELISLADSTALRMISDILGEKNKDEKISKIKSEIKQIRKSPTTKDTKKDIKNKYKKLDELQYNKHYVNVIIDKNNDYKKMFKNGFKINGMKYKRLLGTTGGVKNSTIVFVSEDVHEQLWNKIENDRDMDLEIVPAKLEAYKALTCSASIPVSYPNGIAVIDDCELKFKEDVIVLDDSGDSESPIMKVENDYDVSVIDNDGYGLILPQAMERWAKELGLDYIPSGVCIRNSWTKGMLFTFDFREFEKQKAKGNKIQDVWGNSFNSSDVEVIMTSSMLKLTKAYNSIDSYLECCHKNGYTFSITKICPKELENERYMNYQFLQTYDLSEQEIDELINPTILQYKDILGYDYIKSLLFLRGINVKNGQFSSINEDFIKALSIDKRMINDSYVRDKIHSMLKKQIDKAKTGVIRVQGNYSIVSGDPYLFAEFAFGLEPIGLLKANCNYSKYWNDLNESKVACYRAPMTSHNNIRILNLSNTEEMQYWYQYMPTATIFSGWDTATHALNGMDKDSDGVMTTNNKILVENTRQELPIICLQKSAKKVKPTELDLYNANINGFGDDIGTTTNYITTMIQLLAKFKKNSKEYNELKYRITCGQQYQQNAIDKTKGILCKSMPKKWYDYHTCKISYEDKENKKTNEIIPKDNEDTILLKTYLQSILADKKPYFMCYIYPQQMKLYNEYMKNSNMKCFKLFRLTIHQLLKKENQTYEEKAFVEKFHKKMPVGMANSLMNKIAWKIEKEFDHIKQENNKELVFDYTILKSDYDYDKTTYNNIKSVYKDYIKELQDFNISNKTDRKSKDECMMKRLQFKENFKKKAIEKCTNEKELANILVDMCYGESLNKQFAWDICGNIFVDNLLENNNNIVQYVSQDDNGDIEYGYEYFSLIEEELGMEED